MEFSDELKHRIKDNALHIITVMKNKPRNYLNKQLQDAICNYFLENYAAPYLKDDYKIKCGRSLRRRIEKDLPIVGKKYMNLLKVFKSEIIRVGKGAEYRALLCSFVSEEKELPFESIEWCSFSRKQIVSLLLIVHWDDENILNFYDMWNKLFPNDPLVKEKMSGKQKKKYFQNKTSNKNQVKSLSSLESRENSYANKPVKKICDETVKEKRNSQHLSKKNANYQQFYGKYYQENQSYFYHVKSSFREMEKVQVDRISNLMISADLDNPLETQTSLYSQKNNQKQDNFQFTIKYHNFSEFMEENTQSEVEENSYYFTQLPILQDNFMQKNVYLLHHQYFDYALKNENDKYLGNELIS